MKSNTDYFDSLVSKTLEGSINSKDFEVLRSMLDQNENLQRRYFSFIRNESLMHWEENSMHNETTTGLLHFPYQQIVSVAAMVICLFSAWLIHTSFSDTSQVISTEIADVYSSVNQFDSISNKIRHASADISTLPIAFSSENLEKVGSFISSLQTENASILGGELSSSGNLQFVQADDFLSTPAKSGVLPLKDDKMIQFSDMKLDPENRIAEVSETIRVYELDGHSWNSYKFVDASVHFNQSFSTLSDSTEFSLSLRALQSNDEGNFIEVGTTEQVVISDNDQTTWEKADALFSIPEGADYLVVSIRAKKSGPSAFVANHNNLFADELELSFSDI